MLNFCPIKIVQKYGFLRITNLFWKLTLFIGLNHSRVYAIDEIVEEVNLGGDHLPVQPWWQILPGYEIFLAIFGCLYFIFVIQVLSHFIEGRKTSSRS